MRYPSRWIKPGACSAFLVTLAPCKREELAVDDAVLVTAAGRRHPITVLHLIHEIENGKFLIGNNVGRIDGWVTADAIYGKVVRCGADLT